MGYPFTLPSIVQLCGSAGPGSQRTQIPAPPPLLRKALKLTAGPVPGSQGCQHDSALPQAQARVPFLFPAWGFSGKLFITWGHWLPWPGGPICQTHAFLELSFPTVPFLSLQVTRGLNTPKEH